MPAMAGGRKGKACTSVNWLSGPRRRLTTAAAECLLPFALVDVGEVEKDHAFVGAAAGKAEADNAERADDVLLAG